MINAASKDELMLAHFALQKVLQLLLRELNAWTVRREHFQHLVNAFQRHRVEVRQHTNNVRPKHLQLFLALIRRRRHGRLFRFVLFALLRLGVVHHVVGSRHAIRVFDEHEIVGAWLPDDAVRLPYGDAFAEQRGRHFQRLAEVVECPFG